MRLSDTFLEQYGIEYKPELLEHEMNSQTISLEPLTKPNFIKIAANAQVDKGILQTVLSNMFHLIGEIMNQSTLVELDLNFLGKIFCNDGQMIYEPLNRMKQQQPGK